MPKFVSHRKLFSLLVLAFLEGCSNLSTLQTARTVPPGSSRYTAGGGFFQSPQVDAGIGAALGATVTNLKIPYLEFGFRTGLLPTIDLGAKISIPGSIGVDVKKQFLERERFNAAVGFGLGCVPFTTASGSVTSNHYLDALVPLYASYDFTPTFGLYSSPKYVGRFNVESLPVFSNLVGLTLGARLGRTWGVFAEATYVTDFIPSQFQAVQVNASVFFGSAPATPYALDNPDLTNSRASTVLRATVNQVWVAQPRSPWRTGDLVCFFHDNNQMAGGSVDLATAREARIKIHWRNAPTKTGDIGKPCTVFDQG